MVIRGLGVLIFVLLSGLLSAQDNFKEFEKLAKSKEIGNQVKAINLIDNCNNLQSAQLITGLLTSEYESVRYKAEEVLGKITDEKAIEWLNSEISRNPNDSVRLGIASALGKIKSVTSIDSLTKALKDRNSFVRAEAAISLGLIGDNSCFTKLAEVFNSDSAWLVKANALESLVKLDTSQCGELVKKAFADKNYQVKMSALFNIAAIDKDDAVNVIQKGLSDNDWRVRISASEAAVMVKDKRCIEHLIDRLTKEIGRPREDLLMALKELTGKEFGLDIKAWKSWWLNVKGSFDFSAIEEDKKNASRETAPVEFYTIPIHSRRISFVLDLSGSMRDEYNYKDEKSPSDFTKLDFAKKELARTVNSFDATIFFNIILLGCYKDGTYDKKSKVWKQVLTQATPHSKSDAISFTNKQLAKGWTNIYDALAYAFEDENVDTIFLLSDGGASKGVFTETDEILYHIGKLNKFRKIMINVIHIEADDIKETTKKKHTKLMKGLAELTKGTYIAGEDLESAKRRK